MDYAWPVGEPLKNMNVQQTSTLRDHQGLRTLTAPVKVECMALR